MSDFNDMIIAEFRANGGHVETAGFGDGLVLLHTTGARSGESRISPLMAIEAGGSWLIAASAAGATRHPAWYFNLVADPAAKVETGTSTVPVIATSLEGDEYVAGWKAFTDRSPAFAGYKEKAGDRVIPVVRLDPR